MLSCRSVVSAVAASAGEICAPNAHENENAVRQEFSCKHIFTALWPLNAVRTILSFESHSIDHFFILIKQI